MDIITIAGVGMTVFGRHSQATLEGLAGEALNQALSDASCSREQIDAAFYSGVTASVLTGQTSIAGQIILGRLQLSHLPVFNVENACASGTSAFHLAVQSVESGRADVALAIGAEKMSGADKARALALFEGGWDVDSVEQNQDVLLGLGAGVSVPHGTESERPYSRFMAIYAAFCRFHMREYGLTQRQLAAVSSKNHLHSIHNEKAQYRTPLTVEEVLSSTPVTYPLTIPMCAPLTDGGAAVIVANEKGRRRLGGASRRHVRVAASIVKSAGPKATVPSALSTCRLAADAAYEAAGFGPDEIDVAEVHDATAMGEISVVEKLRFCNLGDGGLFAEKGYFSIGGTLPVNPSGGLESKGHPIGATGLAQIYELVLQLRDEAGRRQVLGARKALQENGGGLLGVDEAVVAVTLLETSGS